MINFQAVANMKEWERKQQINNILELSIYYESAIHLLELEREMNKTVAELNQNINTHVRI